MDFLHTELRKRKIAYDLVNENFSVLKITKLCINDVGENAERLRKHYLMDLDLSFANKCIQFNSHLLTLPTISKINYKDVSNT